MKITRLNVEKKENKGGFDAEKGKLVFTPIEYWIRDESVVMVSIIPEENLSDTDKPIIEYAKTLNKRLGILMLDNGSKLFNILIDNLDDIIPKT